MYKGEFRQLVRSYFRPDTLLKTGFYKHMIDTLQSNTGSYWEKIDDDGSYINFLDYFDQTDSSIVQIIDFVHVRESGSYIVSIGSDDGFYLNVNGDSIARLHKGRNLREDNNLVRVRFNKGLNIVYYEIENSSGNWGLIRKYNRIKNEKIRLNTALYSDIPVSCIISDTARYFDIKSENYAEEKMQLSVVSEAPRIIVQWLDMDTFEPFTDETVYEEFPRRFLMPQNFPGAALLCIKVFDKDKPVFREKIPIFSEKYADSLSLLLSQKQLENAIGIARREAVRILFHLPSKENDRSYSSRMKAQALFDMYQFINKSESDYNSYSGPQMMGYRAESDSSIQMYRVYIPDGYQQMSDDSGLPVLFYIPYIREESDGFLSDVMGYSNYYMSEFSRLSTLNQTIIVTPYGRGGDNFRGKARDEIPSILNQIEDIWHIDRENISYLTSSSGIFVTADLLLSLNIPIKKVYGMAIHPRDMEKEWQVFFTYIKQKYPGLSFHIVNGLEDRIAPIEEVRNWVNLARRNGIDIRYRESKYLGHVLDPELAEREFFEYHP
ncbi:MAG: hypothetical protein J7L86_06915 [Candidatus Marinimicrobia bacterium]|nr:hypothetical protein [Candidatus Neomarinimicrobiota bacterium]